jgi:hypothetical protein
MRSTAFLPTRSKWAWVLLAVLVTWWPTLRGQPVYDDAKVVFGCRAVQEFDLWSLLCDPFFRGHLNYWRPVGQVALGCAAQGGIVAIHGVGLALHALTALLAYLTVRRLSNLSAWTTSLAIGSFIVHPVHAETLAWASSLPVALSGFFSVAAVYAASRASVRAWPIPALLYLLALLAHEIAVPIGLVLVALPAPAARRWMSPGVIAAACGAAVWLLLRSAAGFALGPPEHPVSPLRYGMGCAEVFVRQLMVLLHLEPVTPFRVGPPFFGDDAAIGSGWLWPALCVAFGLVVCRIWWSAPGLRPALALVVAPMLLPVAAWTSLGEFPIQDRYLYMPCLGLGIMVAAGVRRVRWLHFCIVFVLSCLSFGQTTKWASQKKLVEHGMIVAPHLATVQIMAGDAAIAAGSAGDIAALQTARKHYQGGLAAAAPGDPSLARERRAAAYAGVGWCLFFGRDTQFPRDADQVLQWFRQSLAEFSNHAPSWVGVGVVLASCRQFSEAEQALRRAIKVDQSLPEAWYNLAVLQREVGQTEAAANSLHEALRRNPRLKDSASWMGHDLTDRSRR